ncbi:MAG: hypothetical protein OEM02_15710 [Desulfobulbaceae bacterium]|nr:hypothetical protein [Desulfobulbaceae bacterium]
MQKITFFKSAVCPRCYVAWRELKKLGEEFPGLEVEEIDVLSHPIESAKRGIYFVPALQVGSRTLTMIFPRASIIREFVLKDSDIR